MIDCFFDHSGHVLLVGFEGLDRVNAAEFSEVARDALEVVDFCGARGTGGYFLDDCYGGIIAVGVAGLAGSGGRNAGEKAHQDVSIARVSRPRHCGWKHRRTGALMDLRKAAIGVLEINIRKEWKSSWRLGGGKFLQGSARVRQP